MPLASPCVSKLQLQPGGAQVSKGLSSQSAASERVQGGAAAETVRNVQGVGWASSLPAERPRDGGVREQGDEVKSNGLNPAPKGLKLPDDADSEGPDPQRVKSPAAEPTRG